MDDRPGYIILAPENIEPIGKALSDYAHGIEAEIDAELTEDDARLIRRWRVEDGRTWGGVGASWHDLRHARWGRGSVLGNRLCYRAAQLLGENPHDEPWN